ncbi:MAG: PhzF family phenazine biosynthesis protein [Gammaproteobacteria bacterium]
MKRKSHIPVFQVDAFTTDSRFSGNPAAICLLEKACDAIWMQAVAAEMNLSETAFVWPYEDGFELRWFTPAIEVDLCGHATLATAHILWEQDILNATDIVRFKTRSGWLQVKQSASWIELDFPAQTTVQVDAPAGLLSALGIEQATVYACSPDYLVSVASASQLRALSPDFSRLKEIDMRGVVVTAVADEPGIDFVLRFFGPAAGINEDPVTGSAHCALYPFWQKRLHKSDLIAQQISARGGLLKLRGQGERVFISGKAVTVMSGELYV